MILLFWHKLSILAWPLISFSQMMNLAQEELEAFAFLRFCYLWLMLDLCGSILTMEGIKITCHLHSTSLPLCSIVYCFRNFQGCLSHHIFFWRHSLRTNFTYFHFLCLIKNLCPYFQILLQLENSSKSNLFVNTHTETDYKNIVLSL